MPDFLPPIDYTARDYQTIKAALISHVQDFFPNDWQDFLESNLGMVILELVAYVGDQLNYYLDRTANEAFLPTAEQRQNVLNLVKLVGYTPRSASASTLKLRCTLPQIQSLATVIAAYTRLIDSAGLPYEILTNVEIDPNIGDTVNQQVTDELLQTADGIASTYLLQTARQDLTIGQAYLKFTITSGTPTNYVVKFANDGTIILPFNGTGTIDYETGEILLKFNPAAVPDAATAIRLDYQWSQDIPAYQGQTRLDPFSSDGSAFQQFTLTNSKVLVNPRVTDDIIVPDPTRFEVWIGDPGAPFGTGTGVMWRRVDSLPEAGPNEEVYALTIDDKDRVTLLFGDNTNGKIPPAGLANINVIYRTGGGLAGNIAVGFLTTTVTAASGPNAVTVNVTNYVKGSGGAERESIAEIRVNAPRALKTNDTATTEEDYDNLASTYFQPGVGAVVRAKSRNTPPSEFVAKIVHTGVILGTVPTIPPSTYYFALPASPIVLSTIVVSYIRAGLPVNVTASDLGSGLATLVGDANVDGAQTRLRYDQHDYSSDSPAGYVGDGSTLIFTGGILSGRPILPSTVLVHYRIGTTDYLGYDDGAGNLVGTHIQTGTINYATGAVAITFVAGQPPTSGFQITFDYQSGLLLVFSGTPPDAGTNVTISMESGPELKQLPSNNIEVYTWSYDADQNLQPPSSALTDNLKAYLDLRRVLGTSVQVLPGINVRVNLYMRIGYNAAVDPTETNILIVSNLLAYFNSVAEVQAGQDIPLAALYDVLYPIFGLDSVIIENVGVRYKIGTGNGAEAIFNNDPLQSPGRHLPQKRLWALPGIDRIAIYVDDVLAGKSNAGNPIAVLTGAGLLAGSFLHVQTGTFQIRTTAAPPVDAPVDIEYLLDPTNTIQGIDVLNVAIEPFEIGVLGSVFINNIQVR